MKLSNAFDTSASALTAQRFRMDVIASNIANAETTRGKLVDGQWVPYQRKLVVLEPRQSGTFEQHFQQALGQTPTTGVAVSKVVEDQSPFKTVYNPTHPDADANGYVRLPNVDISKEMIDMISSSRTYEANVTAFNASKSIFMKALEIGK